MRRATSCAICLLLQFAVYAVSAQAQSAVTTLGQVRAATIQGIPPVDITIVGTVTDEIGKSEPIRVQFKGTTKIRYEVGTGRARRVTVFADNQGWTRVGTQLQSLPPHASLRRPSLIPVLDLMSEIGNPRLIAADRGLKSLGARSLRQISISLPDAAAARPFGRKLDERVEAFIDPATMLVVRMDRLNRSVEDVDFWIPSVVEFSDYRLVGNLAIAFRVVNTTGSPNIGIHQSTLVISEVQLNTNIPDTVFTPAGGQQ